MCSVVYATALSVSRVWFHDLCVFGVCVRVHVCVCVCRAMGVQWVLLWGVRAPFRSAPCELYYIYMWVALGQA